MRIEIAGDAEVMHVEDDVVGDTKVMQVEDDVAGDIVDSIEDAGVDDGDVAEDTVTGEVVNIAEEEIVANDVTDGIKENRLTGEEEGDNAEVTTEAANANVEGKDNGKNGATIKSTRKTKPT